jgi:hypothetical protein
MHLVVVPVVKNLSVVVENKLNQVTYFSKYLALFEGASSDTTTPLLVALFDKILRH